MGYVLSAAVGDNYWRTQPPPYARLPNPAFFLVNKKADIKLPIVRLPDAFLEKRLQKLDIRVYVLLGFMAEPGNIKRIPAQYMIERALDTGALKEGEELVEPTSGNMGVSMAYYGAQRNVSLTAIVSDSLPDGKLLPIIRQGGRVLKESEAAKALHLETSPGAIVLAQKYANDRGARFLNQYASPWNPQSYEKDAAPLIWEAVKGQLSMLVSATGSKGTLLGFGRCFRSLSRDLMVVSTMPYLGQSIDGTRDLERQRESSHDLSALKAFEEQVDEVTARGYSDRLNKAGIPGGPSSGAAFATVQHMLLDLLAKRTLEKLRCSNGSIGVFTMFADTLYPYA